MKISGEMDFVIISPQVFSSLIAKIHNSPEREVAVVVEEILPPGFPVAFPYIGFFVFDHFQCYIVQSSVIGADCDNRNGGEDEDQAVETLQKFFSENL